MAPLRLFRSFLLQAVALSLALGKQAQQQLLQEQLRISHPMERPQLYRHLRVSPVVLLLVQHLVVPRRELPQVEAVCLSLQQTRLPLHLQFRPVVLAA